MSTVLTSSRKYHYYAEPAWKGGLYASAGLLGSRSGGLVAATWAAMTRLGESGYLARAKPIFETALAMQDAVRSHDALTMMGDRRSASRSGRTRSTCTT